MPKHLSDVEQQFSVLAAQIAQNDTRVSTLGTEIIETESSLGRSDNSLVSVQSKIDQQLQQIEFLQARTKEMEQRKTEAAGRIDEFEQHRKELVTQLEGYKTELAECEDQSSKKQFALSGLEQSVRELNANCASIQADLEDEKSGIIDIVRRTAQLHNEIQSISVFRSNLSNQKQRLSDKAVFTQTELERLLTEKSQHKARLEDIQKVLTELDETLNAKRVETEKINSVITEETKKLASGKEERSAMVRELSVLQDMESRREGLNKAVREILQKKTEGGFDYVEAILADIIEAQPEYASIVEAALEGRSDTLVVNNTAALLADSEGFADLKGRVGFLCGDTIEPFVSDTDLGGIEGIIAHAVEYVKFDSRFAPLVWNLLGKTIVTDSLAKAIELKNMLGDEYKFVTTNGEFVNGQGQIKAGPMGKTSGLISRKSRLRQLQQTIEQITEEIERLEQKIESDNQINEHLAKLRKELRTSIYEANTELMQVKSKLNVIEQNIKRLSDEQPLITSEIDSLAKQIDDSVDREYNNKQKLEELNTVNAERNNRIKELEAQFAESKLSQQQKFDELTELKIDTGKITEQIKGLRQAVSGTESQLQTSAIAIESARREIENSTDQSQKAQRDILTCESQISEMFMAKEKNQQQSRELREKVTNLLEEQKQAEHLVREKRKEAQGIEERINNFKIELGQLEVKEQGLTERVREELQLELADAYSNYEDQQTDWEAVREEINDLRSKIERLGNVNVDAISEQEDLEKRNEFLASQLEDLNNSKTQLQQLIVKLNKQSRDKFAETFEQIRQNFQLMFRKLFGGGKADVILEEAEDILEAGIEIVARPPGKEPRSISLLSGGEKTMTAIALLFAVFKSKPSPFCILDEVDAALDEANNERFNLIVQEFEKESQFIIITHSKRTMSIADMLYGVTMQTRGVSKKISVRFEQSEEGEQVAVA
ncbi:MAG: chromosome segregation protein SMC [Phycisphaerae bacterium]|nr:chromosome segregation protein SMC [Phycisphaerae bacterium]